ncbi:MAG: PorT family protein [Muribaculaceae bacterium]|nr:PorT family protein [Muribaculaceae bacterium]
MIRYRSIACFFSALTVLLTLSEKAQAQFNTLFDTGMSSKLLTLGVRASLTSSNVSPNYSDMFTDVYNASGNWGYGFNVGFVVDLNIKKYFSLQPGIFFSNKSYGTDITTLSDETSYFSYVKKHSRLYYLQIPVLASFKMNLIKGIQLQLEAGPYFALGLGGNTRVNQTTVSVAPVGSFVSWDIYKYPYFGNSDMKNVQMKTKDWGLKIGAGFKIVHKYSIAIYYMAGIENIARNDSGFENVAKARNKEWTLSLGYDF